MSLVKFAEGVIAGGTAGVVVETALYPIDTIKTRLQAGFYNKTNYNEDWEMYFVVCHTDYYLIL